LPRSEALTSDCQFHPTIGTETFLAFPLLQGALNALVSLPLLRFETLQGFSAFNLSYQLSPISHPLEVFAFCPELLL
jgi:hypothetical protein